MAAPHRNLAITQAHFDRVAGHLVDTLQALGVPEPLIDQVVALVSPLQEDIVNTPPTPTGPAGDGAPPMNPSSETHSPAGAAPSSNGQLSSLDFVRASLAGVQVNIFVADTKLNIIADFLRGSRKQRKA